MTPTGFPLTWPVGWPRTHPMRRRRAQFGKTGDRGWKVELNAVDATDRLQRELDLLGAQLATLSSNRELRLDGRPRAGSAEPADPGAAIYFSLKGKPVALACDRWDRVADNIAALAKHIEALRGMDRWGVGSVEQAFAGYQALPAPEPWWTVLGVPRDAGRAEIEKAFRTLAKTAHPDLGGDRRQWDRLQAAHATAIAELNRA